MFKAKRTYLDYLKDISDEFSHIGEFTKKLSYDAFAKDKKTIYAVVRSFEVIGEAVKHIPPDIKKKYPKIPWKKMAGMRDKLIHEYFGVDQRTLWETVRVRIPEVKALIVPLLNKKRRG